MDDGSLLQTVNYKCHNDSATGGSIGSLDSPGQHLSHTLSMEFAQKEM